MSGSGSGRWSFRAKVALAAGVVVCGDVFFYQNEWFGSVIGLFAAAGLAAVILASPAARRDRRACIAFLIAAVFVVALVFDPGFLAWLMFCVALSLAALLPRTSGNHDAWVWSQRLMFHAIASLGRPLRDVLRLVLVRKRFPKWSIAAPVRNLALPAVGGVVVVALFSSANPLIGNFVGRLSLPTFSIDGFRFFLWIAVFTMVWSALRPRRVRSFVGTFDGRGDVNVPGVNRASIFYSLALFNALFLVQNGLDVAYLWGGLPLPEGMTLAEYAHRGAYPLIVTALLAGLFVIVTLRPGSATGSDPRVRGLLVLWIGQNIFLVFSSMLRTIDYIEAYSLTRLRIAALAWMLLVVIGLGLIGWRMLREKSTSWLINRNMATAGMFLAVFCFVDLGAVAANWNVRHAYEISGRGVALDFAYLDDLGDSALLPLIHLERQKLAPYVADRVRQVRAKALKSMASGQKDGWWTIRNAYRLDQARKLLAQPEHPQAPKDMPQAPQAEEQPQQLTPASPQ